MSFGHTQYGMLRSHTCVCTQESLLAVLGEKDRMLGYELGPLRARHVPYPLHYLSGPEDLDLILSDTNNV